MEALRVLVVDDAETTREVLCRQLETAGHTVRTAADVRRALRQLERWPAQLVLTDLRMPGVSGMDLVRHLRDRRPEVAVVMITGYPSIANAVEAGRSGVDDFLAKPFTEDELHASVERAVEAVRRRALDDGDGAPMPGLIAAAPAMAPVVRAIRRAASCLDPVLVTGGPGSGRRTVACAVHRLSTRGGRPPVWIDVAAVPEGRAEAELFGEAGDGDLISGLFAMAHSSSLIVTEFHELPETAQIRLLRALRGGRVKAPGDRRPGRADVRVIAVTSVDLDAAVRLGRLRSDLVQRVAGLTVRLPDLRDRPEDIPALARHFARRWAAPDEDRPPRLTDEVLSRLERHPWPGQVAELEAVVRAAVLAAGGDRIEGRHLPDPLRFSAVSGDRWNRTLDQVDRVHVERVLAETGGNKTRAAEILGIDRRTLRERLRRWQATTPRKR